MKKSIAALKIFKVNKHLADFSKTLSELMCGEKPTQTLSSDYEAALHRVIVQIHKQEIEISKHLKEISELKELLFLYFN